MRKFAERRRAIQSGLSDFVDRTIKWTEELEWHLEKGTILRFNKARIIRTLNRPFVKNYLYFDKVITHRPYQNESIFGIGKKYENKVIGLLCVASSNLLSVLASDCMVDLGLLKQGNGGTQCIPFYAYDENGNRHDNITDWGLEQFRSHYGSKQITKEDIFHYTYAVLCNPEYRKKYELDLKRDFPRLPFYEDFFQWRDYGKSLMDLHINYESAEPFLLKRTDADIASVKRRACLSTPRCWTRTCSDKAQVKVKLKLTKDAGAIRN